MTVAQSANARPAHDHRPSREVRLGFFGFGAAFLILACLAFAHLAIASMISTFVIGMVMLVGAALHLGHAISVRSLHAGALWGLSGLFYLLAGSAILIEPVLGEQLLTLALAIALVLSGIARLVIGIRHRADWIMMSGIASTLAGTIVGMGWPQDALWMMGILVGVDLFVQGAMLLMTGATARFVLVARDSFEP